MSQEVKKPVTPPQKEQPKQAVKAAATSLPPQASPQDTSNWDDRAFTTPTDRIVIETYQGDDRIVVQE